MNSALEVEVGWALFGGTYVIKVMAQYRQKKDKKRKSGSLFRERKYTSSVSSVQFCSRLSASVAIPSVQCCSCSILWRLFGEFNLHGWPSDLSRIA